MGTHAERWVVIGGGMLGLVTAESAVRAGHEVILLESAPVIGGLTSGVVLGDPVGAHLVADRFYHVMLESDRRLLALLAQLGLADQVRWSAAPAVVAQGGRQHPASSLVDLASLPVLTGWDRARVAASITASLALPLPLAHRLRAAPWLRALAGERAVAAFWGPILRAKLGSAATEVSADFLVATFRRLVRARLDGAGDRFGVLPGGYAPIIAALAEDLTRLGVTVRTGCNVRRVRSATDGVWVELASGQTLSADRVVVTAPGPVAARMLPDLTLRERRSLTGRPYLGVICGAFLLPEPPNGAYLTYLVDDVEITGVIGMHALMDPAVKATAGHLVYVPRYCAPDDPWFDEPDDVLLDRLRSEVAAVLPGSMSSVIDATVSRARYVVPLPTPTTPDRMPFTSSIPGVHVISAAQNDSGTANVEQSLDMAAQALGEILKETKP